MQEENTMCTYPAVRMREKITAPLRCKHHALRKLLAGSMVLMLGGSGVAHAGCGGGARARHFKVVGRRVAAAE
jgi:hypothetical protein